MNTNSRRLRISPVRKCLSHISTLTPKGANAFFSVARRGLGTREAMSPRNQFPVGPALLLRYTNG